MVSFSIASTPPGARAMLDGNLLGLTPWVGTLPARMQSATLTVQLNGFDAFTQSVALSQDFNIDVHLQAQVPPAAASATDPVPERKPAYKHVGVRARPTKPTSSPSKPAPNSNCNPPYTLSADGIRTYKAECF